MVILKTCCYSKLLFQTNSKKGVISAQLVSLARACNTISEARDSHGRGRLREESGCLLRLTGSSTCVQKQTSFRGRLISRLNSFLDECTAQYSTGKFGLVSCRGSPRYFGGVCSASGTCSSALHLLLDKMPRVKLQWRLLAPHVVQYKRNLK